MNMEAYPEAAAVLRDAGWKPHDGWGVYTRDTLVMGFQPDGQAFHTKNWAAITEGHPQWGPDTPDTPKEAAAWLVERFKPNPLTTEATLEPLALQSETEVVNEVPEHPESEQTGEAAEPSASAIGGGTDASTAEDFGGTEDGSASGGGALQPYDGQDGAGDSNPEYAFDADYEEAGEDLGAELLDDAFGVDPALLDAPAPEDFAPVGFAPEPEAPQDRFIGLDDLDRVRSLRIGDVATEALRLTTLIEQAVSEQEGEFSNIQAYVVSNLDKHTGAFTPQDETSRATYGRFLELSSARSKIARIDDCRKDATAFLLKAERDDVVAFDVEAAFA